MLVVEMLLVQAENGKHISGHQQQPDALLMKYLAQSLKRMMKPHDYCVFYHRVNLCVRE